MSHAKNDIIKCCQCNESDYSDMMNRIDGKIYCHICADKFEDNIIKEELLNNQMNHLYESPDKLIHLCEKGECIDGHPGTYVVWTKCEIDVPANKSFKSDEQPTCPVCLGVQ